MTDKELMNVSEEAVLYSSSMYEQLERFGFDIYDTSFDREASFEEILSKIRKGR